MERYLREEQHSNSISSFQELSSQLILLYGMLGGAFESSTMGRYFKSKKSKSHYQEMSKKTASALDKFWNKSRLYRNKLEDYFDQALYEMDDQDKLLSIYMETREMSISSLKNLIRFLTYETEQDSYIALKDGIHQIILDTNLYIQNTWNMVQEVLSKQIELNKKRGINTQEKYQLFPLDEDDICPDKPNINTIFESLEIILNDLTER